MSKQAIVVVDFQNDYLASGSWPLVGVAAAVQRAAEVIKAARAKEVPVIHVRHESAEGAPFFVAGTAGAEIIPAVAPENGEQIVVKNYPNAFRDTQLKAMLDAQGIEDVVIVGAMSHMCIDATSRAAADHGYKVTVIQDAAATRDLEFNGTIVPADQVHAAFMSALGFAYGRVVTTKEFLT
ncbi:Isochorismatase hydrolase [Devosia sp. LC5]|uniref:cysteine hydrolase family protein n=1 Tax=Devosia sp. LC5 TaxID=1502724 RepID=UPI0004E338F8|nr:cysteine hydrolase family protein [Devosia sp. LC5]KFC70631.1 Isochorismatase hydrolase [Devosia sp. LC5]